MTKMTKHEREMKEDRERYRREYSDDADSIHARYLDDNTRPTGVKRPRDPSRVAGRSIKIAGGSIIITPHWFDGDRVYVEIRQGDAVVKLAVSVEKARRIASAIKAMASETEQYETD